MSGQLRITLNTLAQATEQQIFDQVAKHLLDQGKKSEIPGNPGTCMYKHNALMCAAGCLISELEYSPLMENKSWETLVSRNLAPKDHEAFIRKLQTIHDGRVPGAWPAALAELASDYGLDFEVVTNHV